LAPTKVNHRCKEPSEKMMMALARIRRRGIIALFSPAV
jgi:hypothetical protein